jgi:hypothetical protein
MAEGNVNASLVPTPPLTVNQFFANPAPTPGNVGVCLSGGGSRALTAGMGQLQALSYLTLNGQPLLSQVKALSTVSGGSWLGVPFEFLRASGPTDAAYLGTYNTDPGSVTPAQLALLPAGNAGVPISSDFFMPEMLALEAYLLYRFESVPANMLWQTVIALNILSAYGLYAAGTNLAPADMFSYDQASLAQITAANQNLASETVYLFADQVGTGRMRRPYLICNMGMFLTEPNTPQTGAELLAPVQATPFFTGIVGTPTGVDANGLTPGGGGVASFAFNSIYVSSSGSGSSATVKAAQLRQWSLTDIVGTSSAFYADKLENQINEWEANPWELVTLLAQYMDEILKWIEHHLTAEAKPQAKAFVMRATGTTAASPTAPASPASPATPAAPAALTPLASPTASITSADELAVMKFSTSELGDIDPAYFYWPVTNPSVVTSPLPTRFADGGDFENTGINGMLAYSDIDRVISFVNTETPMAAGAYGVSDGNGGFIPNTYIVVDESIPPLFGYQPYETGDIDQKNPKEKGYVLYAGASVTDYPQYAHNQVFDSSCFPALLQGLWAASNGNTQPAIFTQQSLQVMPNSWFGIAGGKTVTVVWCYLSAVSAWTNLFQNNPDVAAIIANAVSKDHFPHYDTIDTSLSATEVNLLSGLTAWCVVSADAANLTFSNLFTNATAPAAAGQKDMAESVRQ